MLDPIIVNLYQCHYFTLKHVARALNKSFSYHICITLKTEKWEGEGGMLLWCATFPTHYHGPWQYPSRISQYLLESCKQNPVIIPRGAVMCYLVASINWCAFASQNIGQWTVPRSMAHHFPIFNEIQFHHWLKKFGRTRVPETQSLALHREGFNLWSALSVA